jgi:signal transduction histidine kinase
MFTKIRKWVLPPVYEEDNEKSRASILLNIVLWMFISASSIYGIFAPIDQQIIWRRVLIIVPFVLILLILKQLLNWGYIRFVGILIVSTTWMIFTSAMLFSAGYNNAAFMGYLVVVVCASLILNWRAAIGWGIFSVITSATLLQLGEKGYLPEPIESIDHTDIWIAQTCYIIVTTVLLSQATRKIDEAFAKAQNEIKERKRVEAEREMFIKELETKNAELERFTYTVSHDLKSPLITIGGYLGFLERNGHAGKMDMFDNDIRRVREAAEKMQNLLNDLLELSRIGRLINPSEKIEFCKIVEDALALVDGQLRKRNVQVTVQENLPIVFGDRMRLVEVLQNLLDNAAKYMGNQTSPKIEIGSRTDDGMNFFYVKDNGIGISEEHHNRVFGLFNKLDPKSEGTGIGLALVKRTIEVHGGRIWIESSGAEKGTTFWFTLAKKEENNGSKV